MRDVYLIRLSYSYSMAANDLLLQMQGSTTSGLKAGYWDRVWAVNLSALPLEVCGWARNQGQNSALSRWLEPYSCSSGIALGWRRILVGWEMDALLPKSHVCACRFTKQHLSCSVWARFWIAPACTLFRYEKDFLNNIMMTRAVNVFQ